MLLSVDATWQQDRSVGCTISKVVLCCFDTVLRALCDL